MKGSDAFTFITITSGVKLLFQHEVLDVLDSFDTATGILYICSAFSGWLELQGKQRKVKVIQNSNYLGNLEFSGFSKTHVLRGDVHRLLCTTSVVCSSVVMAIVLAFIAQMLYGVLGFFVWDCPGLHDLSLSFDFCVRILSGQSRRRKPNTATKKFVHRLSPVHQHKISRHPNQYQMWLWLKRH